MVVADWEDAVAPADKAGARQALAQAVGALEGAARARLLVRINAEGTPWHADDLRVLAQLVEQGVAGAMVSRPKAPGPCMRWHRQRGRGRPCCPHRKRGRAGRRRRVGRRTQVVRLAFGHLDFQVDAGMACGPDEEELLPMRMALVLATRRAGLGPAVDGVTVDTRDPERLARDAVRARRMGFGGKLCIHPAQVQPLHAVFDPDAAAVERARQVRQALRDAGGGVCVLDGRMVDAPVLKQAEQVLLRHAWAQRRAAAR